LPVLKVVDFRHFRIAHRRGVAHYIPACCALFTAHLPGALARGMLMQYLPQKTARRYIIVGSGTLGQVVKNCSLS
jgi:hypothetical protein